MTIKGSPEYFGLLLKLVIGTKEEKEDAEKRLAEIDPFIWKK
jgi:hypothetical protein